MNNTRAANANGSKCWNWFRSEDQNRDCGEPALISGITNEVLANYHVDERRVFVAGLSARAAMAVILGVTYTDIYAAVGAQSGLPYGGAHDMPSAFGAMKRNAGLPTMPNRTGSRAPLATGKRGVPTIVFHGDSDNTVSAQNGAEIVEQAIRGHSNELRIRPVAASTVKQSVPMRPIDPSLSNGLCMVQVTHGQAAVYMDRIPTLADQMHAEMLRFFYSQ